MDNLPKLIGPAPSELSLKDFKTKLTLERDRVRRGLNYFKTIVLGRRGRGGKPRKASKATQLTALLKEAGLSPQDMLKGIEKLKEMEKEERKTRLSPLTPPKEEEINDN